MCPPPAAPRSGARWSRSAPSPRRAPRRSGSIPEDRAGFRARNIFAWLRPGYSYGERYIDVTTTPPGAMLDLFYVRSNFQKRYEQTEAPARVVLPKRVEAGPRDAVNIRAFLDGYRQREVSVRVSSSQRRRCTSTSSRCRTGSTPCPTPTSPAAPRSPSSRRSRSTVQVQEVEGGFRVILSRDGEDRGRDRRASTGVHEPADRSRWRRSSSARTCSCASSSRRASASRAAAATSSAAARRATSCATSGSTTSTSCPPTAAPRGRAARADALAAIGAGDVSGCAAQLRRSACASALEPAALARALAPRGSFTDPYLRTAMKRLGEVSPGGRIAMRDGSSFNAGQLDRAHRGDEPAGRRDRLPRAAAHRSSTRSSRPTSAAARCAASSLPRSTRALRRRSWRPPSRPSGSASPRADPRSRLRLTPPVPVETPVPRILDAAPPAGGDAPRERLAALGAEALSDAELVALLLRTGARGRLGARRRAGAARAGTAACAGSRARRSPSSAGERGVGEAKGATLLAALELGRRVASLRLRPGDAIRSPADVFRHFHPRLRDAPHERFLVVLLDGRHRVIRRGAHLAGHADREPRPPARGVRARRSASPPPRSCSSTTTRAATRRRAGRTTR